MSKKNDELIIGINVMGPGQRPGAWRVPELDGHAFLQYDFWRKVADVAERGRIDALFLADQPALNRPEFRPPGAFEPSTLLSTLAAETTHLGFIATASTTLNDPFELANRFLTADYLAGGRIGWNAVTTRNGGIAGANFGITDLPQRDIRYERAYEFVTLVRRLWKAAATGDTVDFEGEHVQFSGRLTAPASAQGHPLVVQAGGSPAGKELAGHLANGVFTAEMTLEAAQKHYAEVKGYARAIGRDPDEVKILPGYALVIGSTEEEAARRYDELEALAPDANTIDRLSGILGEDASAFDLDAELPAYITEEPADPVAFTASLSFRKATVDFARKNKLTVRQLLREYGGYGHPIIIGTPERIADTLETWFRTGAADGFNLMPDVFPEGLEHLVDHVLPLLRERGIFKHEYSDTTLAGRFYGVRET